MLRTLRLPHDPPSRLLRSVASILGGLSVSMLTRNSWRVAHHRAHLGMLLRAAREAVWLDQLSIHGIMLRLSRVWRIDVQAAGGLGTILGCVRLWH